ncbi:hypothetical protein [Massilia aerilata]|uniref:DUF2786 domain-containing protein n=1 Tax=Massilia aerilata TaxID=453817 RepID=A0ABW0RZC9_9BURK
MSKNLGAMLGKLLRAPAPRKQDTQRKAREQAKALAHTHGIEIERLRDGGFNVWPPKAFAGDDPHDGDHYAADWEEALAHVRAYVPT